MMNSTFCTSSSCQMFVWSLLQLSKHCFVFFKIGRVGAKWCWHQVFCKCSLAHREAKHSLRYVRRCISVSNVRVTGVVWTPLKFYGRLSAQLACLCLILLRRHTGYYYVIAVDSDRLSSAISLLLGQEVCRKIFFLYQQAFFFLKCPKDPSQT